MPFPLFPVACTPCGWGSGSSRRREIPGGGVGVPPLAFDAQDFVERSDEEVPDQVADDGQEDHEKRCVAARSQSAAKRSGDDVERRKVAGGVDVADVQVPRPERVGDRVELVLRASGPRAISASST